MCFWFFIIGICALFIDQFKHVTHRCFTCGQIVG